MREREPILVISVLLTAEDIRHTIQHGGYATEADNTNTVLC